ncbi:MAG: exodeoxyribonuclease VII small subunit, partial [Oscillospiraceae bacterium]|nr:exodeoxyribonuclease VII small subunit [Oscillospiraceae bacterium]
GSVPLSDALALFREGTGLVSNCTALLDQAELEIVKLAKGPDGAITEVPFAHEDTE